MVIMLFKMKIRLATENDNIDLLKIYEQYIETPITFEYKLPTEEEFKARIKNITKEYPYIVCEEDNKIVGYAYANKFKDTSLFIVYGCSLGVSDSWWWNKIYERLLDEDFAELFIYDYENEDRDAVIKKFINGCGKDNITTDEYAKIIKHIFVIDFGEETRNDVVFLQLPELS